MNGRLSGIGPRRLFRGECWGTPEDRLLPAFILPLPAAAFAWWILVVRPVWMPELPVRQAALILYLCFAPLPVLMLLARPRGGATLVSLLTLACLLLFGASVFTYPEAVGRCLTLLGTATGAAAIALAMRRLLLALRDVADRRAIGFFLVVLPAVIIASCAQSGLWRWQPERFNLVQFIAVCLCAGATAGGLRFWRRFRGYSARLAVMLAGGLVLDVIAEGLRLVGGTRYILGARLMQAFGGGFLAYFGAAACLVALPKVLKGWQLGEHQATTGSTES